VSILVNGDEDGYKSTEFCLQFPNETHQHYKYRTGVFATGFVNPTIELISAPANTIYREEIIDNVDKSDKVLTKFVSDCSSNNENIPLTRYMREQVCPSLRAYGTVFLILDMPQGQDMTVAQQVENGIWPYVTKIEPENVLNFEVVGGYLVWFAYKRSSRSVNQWLDPVAQSQPDDIEEAVVWTKDFVYISSDSGVTSQINPFGFVPVIIQASYLPRSCSVVGDAPFFATANNIIAANNHLNTINVEVWKHANALLLMNTTSISAVNTDVDALGNFKVKTTADGGVLLYDGVKPEYLSSDLNVITFAERQYDRYMTEAIDNERSAKSVSRTGTGTEQAMSGVALMFLRDPVVANIYSTALDMESCHERVLDMADRMIHNGQRTRTAQVEYKKDYDIKSFDQELQELKTAYEIGLHTDIVYKEMEKKVVSSVVRDPSLRNEAFKQIDGADYGEKTVSDNDLMTIIQDDDI
jgi:hypothetical protein